MHLFFGYAKYVFFFFQNRLKFLVDNCRVKLLFLHLFGRFISICILEKKKKKKQILDTKSDTNFVGNGMLECKQHSSLLQYRPKKYVDFFFANKELLYIYI